MTDSKKKIALAKLGRTRGLKGQMRIEIYNPESNLFSEGQTFRVSNVPGFETLTISEYADGWCRFEEVQSPEEAKLLVNQELYLLRSELPSLKKGSYYQSDLIGCQVQDQRTQEIIGVLKNILYTVSNDIWVMEKENGEEVMVPMIDGVLDRVDLDQNLIFLNVPETV